MLFGCGNLRDAGHQNVRHGIDKTVAVFIAKTVNDFLVLVGLAFFYKKVQTDLSGRKKLRRFKNHEKADLLQKLRIGFMKPDVENVGPCDDSDIKLGRLFSENTDVPHRRNIGDGFDSFFKPRFYVLFHRVSAEHNKHLAVAEQAAVHRIKCIRNQIVIKRIVEQNALSVEHLERRKQVIVVNLDACCVERSYVFGKGNDFLVFTVFEPADHFVGRDVVCKSVVDARVFRKKLVAEY